MDSSGFSVAGGPPSRRELHGPRPTPLKVRNDSYKIKKPPAAPLPPAQPPQQIRRPIIIYTVSPKVIHTTPGNFMSVVQSLTGSSSAAVAPPSSSSALPACATVGAGEMFSPAARLAAIERASAQAARKPRTKSEQILSVLEESLLGIGDDCGVVAAAGILSPVPSALPSIPPNLFTPPSTAERNQINCWFNELGAGSHGGFDRFSGMMNGLFTPSPNNNFFLSSGIVTSPAAGGCLDLFNQFQDF